MKKLTVRYTAEFEDTINVPDDWEFDGSLEALLEFTDLPYECGDLRHWEVGPPW